MLVGMTQNIPNYDEGGYISVPGHLKVVYVTRDSGLEHKNLTFGSGNEKFFEQLQTGLFPEFFNVNFRPVDSNVKAGKQFNFFTQADVLCYCEALAFEDTLLTDLLEEELGLR